MPKSTKISKEDAIKRLKELFPNANFSIIEYEKASAPLTIKCEKCGKIHCFTRLSAATTRINFCSCCKEFKDTKEKVLFLLNNYNFTLKQWTGSAEKVKIICNNCKTESLRFPSEILRNPEFCTECNNSKTVPLSINEVQEKIDKVFGKEEYLLLNYENWRTKVNIKHLSCKTMFTQNIGHFLDGCGCPKCNKKRSKGEQAISLWLEKNNVNFISQYIIKYKDNSRGYFDFFIPNYNVAIEYNGEQHYNEENIFNKKNKGFENQKKRDIKKRNFCEINNIKLLEIPYWELKNIDNILSSEFNDYLGRE